MQCQRRLLPSVLAPQSLTETHIAAPPTPAPSPTPTLLSGSAVHAGEKLATRVLCNGDTGPPELLREKERGQFGGQLWEKQRRRRLDVKTSWNPPSPLSWLK